MDSEACFEAFIKVDQGVSDSDDDKENETNLNDVANGPCKAKKKQFEKIGVFLKHNNVEALGKDTFSALWTDLITEVNALGPPAYTENEWKTKWSQHKYNTRKRSRSKTETDGQSSIQVAQSIAQDQQPSTPSTQFILSDIVQDVSEKCELVSNHSEILDKLNVLIEKQDAVLVKMDKTNSLLEVIARRA